MQTPSSHDRTIFLNALTTAQWNTPGTEIFAQVQENIGLLEWLAWKTTEPLPEYKTQILQKLHELSTTIPRDSRYTPIFTSSWDVTEHVQQIASILLGNHAHENEVQKWLQNNS